MHRPREALIVERGETLQDIADRAFGTGGAWPYLARLNNLNPTHAEFKPKVGDLVVISGTRPVATPSPGRQHRHEGDNPWT